MLFVSFWLSFGIALFLLNHVWNRTARMQLPALSTAQRWELVGVGVIGGILSAILGNGLDICTFAFVTLLYLIIVAQPVGALLIIQPSATLLAFSGAVFLFGCGPFFWLTRQASTALAEVPYS